MRVCKGTRQLTSQDTLLVQGGILLGTIWISHQGVILATFVTTLFVFTVKTTLNEKVMKMKLGKRLPVRG